MGPRCAFLAAAVVSLGVACDDRCDPPVCATVVCPEAVTLSVTDAGDGAPVAGATAAAGGVPCSSDGIGVVVCRPGEGAVQLTVTVSAPGYAAREVVVTIVDPGAPATECECQRCASWEPTAVALEAE